MWNLAIGLVPIVLGIVSLVAPWVLHLHDVLAVVVVAAGGVLLVLVGLALVGPVLRGLTARRR